MYKNLMNGEKMKLHRKFLRKMILKELNEMKNLPPVDGGGPSLHDRLSSNPNMPTNLDASLDDQGGLSYDQNKTFLKIHKILTNSRLGKMALDANKSSIVGEAAMDLAIALVEDMSQGY